MRGVVVHGYCAAKVEEEEERAMVEYEASGAGWQQCDSGGHIFMDGDTLRALWFRTARCGPLYLLSH